jgi:hypothetical protein
LYSLERSAKGTRNLGGGRNPLCDSILEGKQIEIMSFAVSEMEASEGCPAGQKKSAFSLKESAQEVLLQ